MNKNEENIEIGRRIAKARESAGLTQERLGEIIERSTQTIQNYEKGKTPIPAVEVSQIAKATKIQAEIIAFGKNIQTHPAIEKMIVEIEGLDDEDKIVIRQVLEALIAQGYQKKRFKAQMEIMDKHG